MEMLWNFVVTYGISSLGQGVTNIYGGYTQMVGDWLDITVNSIEEWTSNMSAGEWAIFIGICALELLVIILTAGSEAAVRLGVGIALAAATAAGVAIIDALDSDGTPTQSLLQAISNCLD
jgi:hypothetical protein